MSTSTEENKALVRRFHEELWRGNVVLIDELMTPQHLRRVTSVTYPHFAVTPW